MVLMIGDKKGILVYLLALIIRKQAKNAVLRYFKMNEKIIQNGTH